jgi:hypothetical protein
MMTNTSHSRRVAPAREETRNSFTAAGCHRAAVLILALRLAGAQPGIFIA